MYFDMQTWIYDINIYFFVNCLPIRTDEVLFFVLNSRMKVLGWLYNLLDRDKSFEQ